MPQSEQSKNDKTGSDIAGADITGLGKKSGGSAEPYGGFEQGPIRPPSEAGSLLVRITRNCPWNRCTFCPIYKQQKFSRRPVDHVLRDIDTIRAYVDVILKARAAGGSLSHSEFMELMDSRPEDRQALHAARNFVMNGMQSIFLQDGNSLVIKPDDLVRILKHLRSAFPDIDRVTSYARSSTLARISDEDLGRMAEAGLNRIHIGMESGSDKVLKRVKKGVDKATQILAGQKVKRAGMELSEYHMPGLGGADLWEENARETADALNQINPDFIRLRTLALPDGAPLSAQARSGEFQKQGEVATAKELLLFLESLDGINATVKSDHILNLFPEVDGVLPGDREKILRPVREFMALSPHEQMLYCVGRRNYNLNGVGDLRDSQRRAFAERTCAELGATPENMDEIIDQIMKRWI